MVTSYGAGVVAFGVALRLRREQRLGQSALGRWFPHMDSNHDSGIQSPLSCL